MLGKGLDFFRTLDMRLPYDSAIVSKIHSRESERHDFAKGYVMADIGCQLDTLEGDSPRLACGHICGVIFFIDNRCRKDQPTVGSAIPEPGGPGLL